MENSYGLRDYRLEVNGDDLRGLGAIEGRVDRLVANRMKKRGMSWTILKPGLKLGCRLYMDHSKIVPGFKFSGHCLLELWRFNSMAIRDSHRPTVDSNMPPI